MGWDVNVDVDGESVRDVGCGIVIGMGLPDCGLVVGCGNGIVG
jgi:hypothetical protein